MDILDKTKTRLQIFCNQIEINKDLPKWVVIEKEVPAAIAANVTNKHIDVIDSVTNKLLNQNNVTLQEYLDFDSKDFNIYLGKRIINETRARYGSTLNNYIEFGVDRPLSGQSSSLPKFICKLTKFYRKYFDSNNIEREEEVFEMNIFDFFDNVKILTKENITTYIDRIKPYCIALKQAQDMGQQALVDKLTADIFNNKFESILYANNFLFKITEEQLVDFVKKTEKGVQLCYIKNFVRPIPQEVIDKKKQADELLVFDNYCVLHYDPEKKSFKQTEAEKEAERKKKADPILFGMISGSTNLYYITDWIDEYCDLTLDEFIKVSGLEKQDISITEKIKL